jgi:V-type H+-transporting ATPase subunit a
MIGLKTRLADMRTVIAHTKNDRERVLNEAAQSVAEWTIKCKKLKAIYHTMNQLDMDVSRKCLIAECWTPSADVQLVQKALDDVSKASSSTIATIMNVIGTKETPPTFHRTNKFTQGFQNLIDAYGVASYREANPALFTIITFPFLFSVMFGDVGHGFILALIGGWMVLCETRLMKIKEEIFGMFFGGRYIILLMGLFSIYSGFIYNDVFGKSMNLFGSSWSINYNISTVMENPKLQLNPSEVDLMTDRTYPLGIDPIWQVADNKIIFLNSFKMKLSIILGIAHMVLGLSLSVANNVKFRKRSAILLEFAPQIAFLLLLFGYLVFMAFFKWIRFSPKAEQPFSPGCAPSVLVYFINMMLLNEDKALEGCEAHMYPGQSAVQLAFVIIAVLCIPCILLGKPLFIMYSRKRKSQMNASLDQESVAVGFVVESLNGEDEEEEESMNDVWTHQAIHTIEYVLGTVSHTASYLRLWALSLAHARELMR